MRCVLAILGLHCWRATGFRAAPPPRARVRRASSADTLDSAAADAVPPTPSPGLPAGAAGVDMFGTPVAADGTPMMGPDDDDSVAAGAPLGHHRAELRVRPVRGGELQERIETAAPRRGVRLRTMASARQDRCGRGGAGDDTGQAGGDFQRYFRPRSRKTLKAQAHVDARSPTLHTNKRHAKQKVELP